jgi:cyclic pyranopterin phosphate synthase
MRVSITDRCNLRCKYCMPNGVALGSHAEMLTYEELLRVCGIAVDLGVDHFKVTGGEPFARLGCAAFIARLRALPGVRQVTLTTNGLLLKENLPELLRAGIDGMNVSLDTPDASLYRKLTGDGGADAQKVLAAIEASVTSGIKTKVNAVLLEECFDSLLELAALAERMPVDVRFIELMPIGEASAMRGIGMDVALSRLRERWPDLSAAKEKRGNGPARYFSASGLKGKIGFIDAMSHSFCESCNRVRLTPNGMLKPCLCYGDGEDLSALLRNGGSDGEIRERMRACIEAKPKAHCFSRIEDITEHRIMSAIGG